MFDFPKKYCEALFDFFFEVEVTIKTFLFEKDMRINKASSKNLELTAAHSYSKKNQAQGMLASAAKF